MTNMMKNIPPEQMQKMMDMSMMLGAWLFWDLVFPDFNQELCAFCKEDEVWRGRRRGSITDAE